MNFSSNYERPRMSRSITCQGQCDQRAHTFDLLQQCLLTDAFTEARLRFVKTYPLPVGYSQFPEVPK